MDKKQKIYIFTFFLVFILFYNNNIVYGSSNSRVGIDLRPSSNSYLFELLNLKPGDLATRKLTIQNRGDKGFTYKIDAQFKVGSKKLYDEFLLKVWGSNTVLYDGMLKDYKGISPRYLKSKNEEDLMFRVEFPIELGNEYQGLGFELELIFIAENVTNPHPKKPENIENPERSDGLEPDPESEDPVLTENPTDEDDPDSNIPESPSNPQDPEEPVLNPPHPIDPDTLNSPPTDGQILPSTSTNIYNFIFGGALLLLTGALILYLSRKRNLDMKV